MIGIYKLVFNGLEDWPYVGQSRNIEARYKSHCLTLARGLGGKKLVEAFQLAGEPALHILEECKEEDLNVKERYWISALDSLENGLNGSPGGDIYFGIGTNHYNSKYTREQIVKGMTLLTNPDKAIVDAANEVDMSLQALYSVKAGITHQWFQEEFPEIFIATQGSRRRSGCSHHMAKYSRDQILKVFNLLRNPTKTVLEISKETEASLALCWDIAKGRTHQWLQEEFPAEFIEIQNINRKIHCTYEDASVILVSPDGQEYNTEGESGSAFAKKIGESSTFGVAINKVLKGQTRQYKGWTLKGNELKKYRLLSPIDTEHIVTESKTGEFCKTFGISRTNLTKLFKGKSTLGWSLLEII